MSKRLVLLVVGLGVVAVLGVMAGPAGAADEEAQRWGVPVTFGLHAAENEAAGMGDVLIPLYRHERGLIFLNPRASFNDRDEEEVNLGLGVRQLFEGRLPFILGANVYYDGRWTRNHNRFDQLGLGAEFLSDWVDARANYYLPDHETALADTVQTETVETRRSRAQEVETWWGDPYGAGHDIRQGSLTRLTLRETVSRDTLTQVYENWEAALEGWDAEVGLRLPVFESALQTRVFAGYQHFDNPFGDALKGWTGRLEVRALEGRLIFDAQVFENRELNQTDWRAGARVRLPFEIGALAQRRNPFGGAPAGADRGLRGRLDDMVMRDPKIQMSKSGYVEDVSRRAVTTERQTKTTRQEVAETMVLAEGVTFVDGDVGSDANPGTAEAPKATVQGGLDSVPAASQLYTLTWPDGAPRRVVYVQATGGAYAGAEITQPDVALLGSGMAIPAYGGKVFGGGARPLIQDTVATIRVGPEAQRAAIAGFEITTDFASGTGIHSQAGQLVVWDNWIQDNLQGVQIMATGAFDSWVVGNRFDGNVGGGIGVSAQGNSGDAFRLVVADNAITGGAWGMVGSVEDYDGGTARISGNRFTDVSDVGLWYRMMAGVVSTEDVLVEVLNNTTENTATAVDGRALYASARSQNGDVLLRMAGNVVDQATEFGIYGEVRAMQDGNAELWLEGNRASGAGVMGLRGRAQGQEGEARVTAIGNDVTGGEVGVWVVAETVGSGDAEVWLEANRVAGVVDTSIVGVALTSGGSDAFATAIGNDVTGGGSGIGVSVEVLNGGDGRVTLIENRVADCGVGGVWGRAVTEDEGTAEVLARGNEVDRSGGIGLDVRAEADGDGDAVVELDSNRADHCAGLGLSGSAMALTGGDALILTENNLARTNGGGGMELAARSWQGQAQVLAAFNETTDNADLGLSLSADAQAGDAMVYAIGNESHRNANPVDPTQGGGLSLLARGEASAWAIVIGNHANGNAMAGIEAQVETLTGDGMMYFVENQVEGNEQGGLYGSLAAQVGMVSCMDNQATGHVTDAGYGLQLDLTVTESIELLAANNALQGNLTGLALTVVDPLVPGPVAYDLVFSGDNQFNNTVANVRYDGPAGAALDARANWWGQFPPNAALIVQAGAGTIDSSDPLPVAPTP